MHSKRKVNAESESTTKQSNYFTMPVILNVDDTVYRNEEDTIHIIWTPIIDQEKYWLKVKIDDPFIATETEVEYECNNTWYDIDVSKYPYDTVMFISIAVWDKENSQKVYSDPISFKVR